MQLGWKIKTANFLQNQIKQKKIKSGASTVAPIVFSLDAELNQNNFWYSVSKLQAHSCASQHLYIYAHKINVFYIFFPFMATKNHPETIPELAKENQQHTEY